MTSTDSPRRPIIRRALVGLTAAALVVGACGSSDDTVSSGTDADERVSSAAEPDDATVSSEAVADDGPASDAIQENGPITVEGVALDPFDSSIEDLAVGKAAPLVSGQSFDGSPISFGAAAAEGAAPASGSPTLVVFLAHWCPHCNDEIPELIELQETGSLPADLDVIGVSTAVEPTADNYPPSEWIVEKGWPWSTMADDVDLTAIKAYGGTSFPFTVVLDGDGTVLARRAGTATADETIAFLDDALGS